MNEFDYYKRESEKLMKTVEVKIRLPEDIHAQLKELAAKEGRSMNKQITWILTTDFVYRKKIQTWGK